jgi:hypothetical protein
MPVLLGFAQKLIQQGEMRPDSVVKAYFIVGQ